MAANLDGVHGTLNPESEEGSRRFLCPGYPGTISRSVHIARMNAGWPVCDTCEWRQHTEGLPTRTIEQTERIRELRKPGVRRTEFGLRGPYLNVLNRRMAEALVRVFCIYLAEPAGHADSSVQQKRSELANVSAGTTPDSERPVVIGYDARTSSPDLFAGVSSSVREWGLPVVDIGRCTAASMQEALRALPKISGAVFVTGAGKPPSWCGFDAFDSRGHSVPVVWKDFGIQLISVESDGQPGVIDDRDRVTNEYDTRIEETLSRLRTVRQAPLSEHRTPVELQLVMSEETASGLLSTRIHRRSGSHEFRALETDYREWLQSWFPEHCELLVEVVSSDPLIRDRISALAEGRHLNLFSRPDAGQVQVGRRIIFTVHEDDRFFGLQISPERSISGPELARRLNEALAKQSSCLTAHCDEISGRFWLTDIARPASPWRTEQIQDALATLGLILRLMVTRHLSLG